MPIENTSGERSNDKRFLEQTRSYCVTIYLWCTRCFYGNDRISPVSVRVRRVPAKDLGSSAATARAGGGFTGKKVFFFFRLTWVWFLSVQCDVFSSPVTDDVQCVCRGRHDVSNQTGIVRTHYTTRKTKEKKLPKTKTCFVRFWRAWAGANDYFRLQSAPCVLNGCRGVVEGVVRKRKLGRSTPEKPSASLFILYY